MCWFRSIILAHTKGRQALLAIDSFSALETEEFNQLAQCNNVDIVVIPGGCTMEIQPLDVCLNKLLKSVIQNRWIEYVHSLVDTEETLAPQMKLTPPTKPVLVQWITERLDFFRQQSEKMKISFLVCGIMNALNGSKIILINMQKN